MKHFITAGIITLLLLGLGVYWWSINPLGRVNEAYSINPYSSFFTEEKDCSLINDLLVSEFIVDYPRAIRYKESGEMIITINNSTPDGKSNYSNNPSGICAISLEVWIDVRDILIEPGNRSFEPFADSRTQYFIFEITPLAARLEKGTIWIHAIITNKNDAITKRIPLFAIPFNVRVKSLYGIPPKIIRIFDIVFTVMAWLSLLLNIKLNKSRK